MLIKQEFKIRDNVTVTFDRYLNTGSGIEDWNTDSLIIKHHNQIIILRNEEAHEFLKICRDTKFIFTNGNQ